MNKTIKTILLLAAALAAAGRAKTPEEGANDANVRHFNAWMEVNYPDLQPSGLGIYVIEEEEGTGVEVKEDGFIIADYVISDLEGNISSYTSKEIAKQLGTFDTTAYYGPKVLTTIKTTIQAGLADAVIGMKAGGRKKIIIPSWLMTYKSYDDPADYIKNSSTGTNTIYDITIRDFADSINNYEISQIEKYIKANPETFNSKIGEKGRGFSEGQTQRIAIARAILRDAPILLLDEATSALDVTTERKVLKNIIQQRPNKTCIVTTHRPTVLNMCQRVYRVLQTKVTELSEAESSRMAMDF